MGLEDTKFTASKESFGLFTDKQNIIKQLIPISIGIWIVALLRNNEIMETTLKYHAKNLI